MIIRCRIPTLAAVAAALLPFSLMGQFTKEQMLPATYEKETLVSGLKSLEGPAWDAANQQLFFSEQEGAGFALYTVSETGSPSIFRQYTNKVNGNAFDNDGNLITCESGNRRVVRTEANGEVTILVDKDHEGETLNEPNDVVVKSDGTIWFTTPSWTSSELARQYVLRYDPATEEVAMVVSGVDKPNGLTFSPDEQYLYLNDNGANRVRRYIVNEDNSLTPDGNLITGIRQWPDGITVDVYGNLFVAVYGGGSGNNADRGVLIYSPDGTRLDHIPFNTNTTNVEFGGEDGRTLFVTTGGSVVAIPFPPVVAIDPPGAPASLDAVSGAEGIALSWEAATGEVSGYTLERRAGAGGEWEALLTIDDSEQLTHTDTSAVPGIFYSYQIRAFNSGGDSDVAVSERAVAGNDFYTGGTRLENGLLQTTWFGEVLAVDDWIWSFSHHWWYIAVAGPGSFWAYDFAPEVGWIWTNAEIYPFVFSAQEGVWLVFVAGDAETVRYFQNVDNGEYIVVNPLE